jgi:NAD(P)-dependent dehydrogenase (short-subunit alcohol dehydrogenase family)
MQKTILITGCSSGIGLCAALTLLQRGYRVFASARKAEDVVKLKTQGLVDSLILDINDSASIKQAVTQVLSKTGGTLDALFNNAGYAIPGAVEDLSRDMMRNQFETNVFGTMELTNLLIPIMRQQGHGRIIQNTSILGTIAMPYRGAYNASKFALEGFSHTLRIELRHTNIHISIIAPGPIASQFRNNAISVYQKLLRDKDSLHAERYKKMEALFSAPPNPTERKLTLSPNAVVDKLILALEKPNPKVHYYIGLPAHIFAFLRRVLPDQALDWVIAKVMQGEMK